MNWKSIVFKVLLSALAFIIIGCGSKKIHDSSNLFMLEKGMTYDLAKETIKKYYNDNNSNFEDTKYIKVLGLKHRYVELDFPEFVYKRLVVDGIDGDRQVTTFYLERYFIVFDENDNLLTMGYPFEMLRNKDKYIARLGRELSLTLIEEEE